MKFMRCFQISADGKPTIPWLDKEARDVAQQALEGQLRGISALDHAVFGHGFFLIRITKDKIQDYVLDDSPIATFFFQ